MRIFSMRFVALFSVLALSACGGGGSDKKDPSSVDFDNLEGSITNDNAEDVMDEALEASNSAVFGLFKENMRSVEPGRRNAQTGAECVTTSNETATIDLGCIWDGISDETGCSADGTYSITYGSDDNSTSGTFDWSITCSDITVACDGTSESAIIDQDNLITAYCYDSTCSYDGEEYVTNECFSSAGSILVDSDDGSVRCDSITPDETCSTVSSSWEDAEGPLTITCDVVSKDSRCPTDATGITDLGDCTVSRP